jgi:hypothetical protein
MSMCPVRISFPVLCLPVKLTIERYEHALASVYLPVCCLGSESEAREGCFTCHSGLFSSRPHKVPLFLGVDIAVALINRAREQARLICKLELARLAREPKKNSIHVYIQQYNQLLVNFILI